MQQHMNRVIVVAGILATIASIGCRRNQVEEISLESSGLEIREQGTSLAETDWPSWRGPDGNGIALDQPIVTQWDGQTNVIWDAGIPGRGHGSPVIVGDSVYLATALEAPQRQVVMAFDNQTGDLRWQETAHEGGFTGEGQMHAKGSHANSTVACDGQHVYAVFLNAGKIHVTAFDTDGGRRWQTDVGSFRSKFGFAPSPVLFRSSVLIAADHMDGGYLAALDRGTGQIVWRTPRPALSSYSSLCVTEVAGIPQILISGCDQVASYDPMTGKAKWSCAGTTEATCGTVISDGTRVFASGGYPGHETLCVLGDGTAEVVWRNSVGVYEPSLLLANNNLFAVTDNGIAYCWDAQTGQLMWRQRLRGSFSASPVLCNGLILVSNLNGETYIFEAKGDEYREVAKNKLGDDCYTSFAINKGRLFTRVGVGQGEQRRERLYCLGAPSVANNDIQ